MKRNISLAAPCVVLIAGAVPASAQTGGGFDLSWSRIAGGGGTSAGGGFELSGTIGQHDAGQMGGGGFVLSGGFWAGSGTEPQCYANCDGSSLEPILNVDDFTCFINQFAAAQGLPHEEQIAHYANCDGSSLAPALNVDDFTCFINAFASGCP